MNFSAISHRCAFTDSYALDKDTLCLNIKTAYDIDEVYVIWHDPASFRKTEDGPWRGGRVKMEKAFSLKYHIIWSCTVKPPYKRTEYYFELHGKDECGKQETYLLFENDFALPSQFEANPDLFLQYKNAWLNPADVVSVPSWVKDTIWYQIMPDRFCSAGNFPKRLKNREWDDVSDMQWHDFFGGDLPGVTSKLDYLKDLGISGIYFTPIFKSCSNHKYNIEDYSLIDPDFGTDEDMRTLVREAHKRGIRIMIDAVFNHSGNDFPIWLDVVENGEKSKYKDWFFVNKFPLKGVEGDTSDGRYFSFDFVTAMPKLNTNNPEVQKYFTDICSRWVKDWDVDAIRFDVANEVSHDFIKVLHRKLCAEKKDLFLLGEIWTDSLQWLCGDEYHSVMNYPFMIAMGKIFAHSGELSHEMDNVYSLYFRQTNTALFNFLDTHDTGRAINACKNMDEFYQKLVLLMSMEGTPCIFYGTEIAVEGEKGPYIRRPMPWHELELKEKQEIFANVKKIIALRNTYPALRAEKIQYLSYENKEQVCFERTSDDGKQTVTVCLNLSEEDMEVSLKEGQKVLFGVNHEAYASGKIILHKDGSLVLG